MACFFYQQPDAKVILQDLLDITDKIRFPIYPDITINTVIEAVYENPCFSVDIEGFITCNQVMTAIDLNEFMLRLPQGLVNELHERVADAHPVGH